MHVMGGLLWTLTFYKAVRLAGHKVWLLALSDGLWVVGPDEQSAGEKLAVQLQLEGAPRVAEQDAPTPEVLAAQLWLRVGQRVRRADARFEAVEELTAWPVEELAVQPVADSGARYATTRLVPEAVR